MKELKKSVGIVYLVAATLIVLGLAMWHQQRIAILIPSQKGGRMVKMIGKDIVYIDGEMALENKIILDSLFGDVTISKKNGKTTIIIPSKTGSDYELDIRANDIILKGTTISNVTTIGQTFSGDLIIITSAGEVLIFSGK